MTTRQIIVDSAIIHNWTQLTSVDILVLLFLCMCILPVYMYICGCLNKMVHIGPKGVRFLGGVT